jgi:hypothetical protein
MEKKKTSKYFENAISKIILVVIGVFIAVSINSCNGVHNIK